MEYVHRPLPMLQTSEYRKPIFELNAISIARSTVNNPSKIILIYGYTTDTRFNLDNSLTTKSNGSTR
jgi:hypothetical protein